MTEPRRHLMLFYDYVDGILELRVPHRPAHLELISEAHAAGEMLMAGALGDPPHGSAFVFAGDDEDIVRTFVARDPYIAHGLVTDWRIEPWAVVTE
jgi:uncharacterized protein YciI